MGERVRGVINELRSRSMRAATLVGLASIPAGFLWIYFFAAESAVVIVLAGVVVGAIYSDRPTPVHRAAARVGIFAPIPTLLVQSYTNAANLLTQSWDPALTPAFAGLLVLMVLAAWVMFAILLVIVPAVVTSAMVRVVRPYVSDYIRSPG